MIGWMPLRAPYSASDAPILPVEMVATNGSLHSLAMKMHGREPRSLKLHVGLRVSFFKRRLFKPTYSANDSDSKSGVAPSPREQEASNSSNGQKSRKRSQIVAPLLGLARSSLSSLTSSDSPFSANSSSLSNGYSMPEIVEIKRFFILESIIEEKCFPL